MRKLAIRMILMSVMVLLSLSVLTAQVPDGQEILRRMDANTQFQSLSYTGRMEIDLGNRVLVKTMTAVASGDGQAFVEFTNPEDSGVRYLKIDNQLWMYFPEEQETVAISGHLLKEGMMGSDLSYEDALDNASLQEMYDIQVLGSETLDGRPCYVLDLKAKRRDAPYDRQKIWVDSERWIGLKTEQYAKTGKLLKVSRSLEVQEFSGRWYATRFTVQDMLRRGGGTTFSMTDLSFNTALKSDQFSMRTLTR